MEFSLRYEWQIQCSDSINRHYFHSPFGVCADRVERLCDTQKSVSMHCLAVPGLFSAARNRSRRPLEKLIRMIKRNHCGSEFGAWRLAFCRASAAYPVAASFIN